MKTIALFLLFALFANAQTTTNIGSIVIKSKIPMRYDARDIKQDTIYITIRNWSYDQENFNAEVIDYIKLDSVNYRKINRKIKRLPIANVNYLFGQISPSVSSLLDYNSFLNELLKKGLLLITQTDLIGDKTVYGGNPSDWE